jgi:hypothetical protein
MNPSICKSLYRYKTSDWSSCSNGKQTRTIECVDQNNITVNISNCKFIPFTPPSETLCTLQTTVSSPPTPNAPSSTSSTTCQYTEWVDDGQCYVNSNKVIVVNQKRTINNQPCSQTEPTARTWACDFLKVTPELIEQTLPTFESNSEGFMLLQ